MKTEDAYYHLLLLKAGLDDGYDAWLDEYLEREDPLSDIVLDLALCGSDLNKTISCLNSYCGSRPELDEWKLRERLRLFLKNLFHTGRMDQRTVAEAMYRIASAHGAPWDLESEIWGDFYDLEDHLTLVEDGIASRAHFDAAFQRFLDDGIPLEGRVWQLPKKQSLWERIGSWCRTNLCRK